MVSDNPPRKTKLPARLILMFVFAAGFVFLVVGAFFLLDSYRFSRNSVAVTGIVVSVAQVQGSDSVTYRPEVEYIDLRGLKRRGTTALSSSGYNFPVGSRLDIRYDPAAPGKVRLDNWFALWGFSLIFVSVGIVPLFVAKFVLTKMRRAMASATAPPKGGKQQPHWKSEKHYEALGPVKHSDENRTFAPTVRRNR